MTFSKAELVLIDRALCIYAADCEQQYNKLAASPDEGYRVDAKDYLADAKAARQLMERTGRACGMDIIVYPHV